jgi:hypothetical protein
MENPLHNFFSNIIFSTKKQPKKTKIYIEHRKGCTCPKCIQKWLDADIYYGKIEAYELTLPEGHSILFLNKEIKEKPRNDE